MSYLCDTNIISELVKPQPNPGVLAWSSELTAMALSVITLEEITYGLMAKPNPRIRNIRDFEGCELSLINPFA